MTGTPPFTEEQLAELAAVVIEMAELERLRKLDSDQQSRYLALELDRTELYAQFDKYADAEGIG